MREVVERVRCDLTGEVIEGDNIRLLTFTWDGKTYELDVDSTIVVEEDYHVSTLIKAGREVKPHKCAFCSETFVHESGKKRHETRKHTVTPE